MAKKSRPKATPPEKLYPLFDSHTHLYAAYRKGARAGDSGANDGAAHEAADLETAELTYEQAVRNLMERAAGSGLAGVCTIGDGMDETERALEAAHFHPRVWAACAIHPTRAHELDSAARDRLQEMAQDPRCVAIGETGLDAYWLDKDESTPSMEVQEEALRWHIDLAVNSGKPLMIHNREADADLLHILADAPQPTNVILHCFSSPLDVAKEALDRGWILSFAGNSTFKTNVELREAARIAPAGQILIETDAPFMTPEPFRGQRNEPSYVGYTARVLADVRDMNAAAFGQQVTDNALRIFGLGELTDVGE